MLSFDDRPSLKRSKSRKGEREQLRNGEEDVMKVSIFRYENMILAQISTNHPSFAPDKRGLKLRISLNYTIITRYFHESIGKLVSPLHRLSVIVFAVPSRYLKLIPLRKATKSVA